MAPPSPRENAVPNTPADVAPGPASDLHPGFERFKPGPPSQSHDETNESETEINDTNETNDPEVQSPESTESASDLGGSVRGNIAQSTESTGAANDVAMETEAESGETETGEAGNSANAAGSAEDSTSEETRAGLSLFDQLLDSVMETSNSRTAREEHRPSSSDAELGPASVASTGTDSSSAIVITVNYMFMDVPNDPNPGRTGSLVVTLPNNAANREPRIISQFISLATRMAYSALFNGPKSKPGISVEKFESFKKLNAADVAADTCSICYETYEDLEDVVVTKRRKMSPVAQTPTETASIEERPEERNIEGRGLDSESASEGIPSPPSTQSTSTEAEQKPFLCDHEEEYQHVAVQMPCGHIFGRSCLAHWLKENANCPLCRLSVGDVEQTPSTPAPISYVRFGGLGNESSDVEQAEEPTTEDTDSERRPGFLRRATLVIFNSSGREAPPPPLEAGPQRRETRSRNSGLNPMINNILNFLRRSRRLRETDNRGAPSLFTSGVASRRTPTGVQTHSSDLVSLGEFFETLRNMYGDRRESGRDGERENEGGRNEERENSDADES